MMKINCPKCHASLEPSASQCENCGQQIQQQEDPSVPPQGKGAFLYIIFIVCGLGLLIDKEYYLGGFILAAGVVFILYRIRMWLKMGRKIK